MATQTMKASSASLRSQLLSEPSLEHNAAWVSNSSSTNTILKVDTINQINGIPPIPDNIVDPPAIFSNSVFEDNRVTLQSWDQTVNKSGPFVGRDYIDRVILRGSVLMLLPLKITMPLTSGIKGIFGAGSGELGFAFGAANYGYEVEFDTTRYTETVLMHFFMAANAIGVDFTDSTAFNRAKNCLPENIFTMIKGNTYSEASGINTILNDAAGSTAWIGAVSGVKNAITTFASAITKLGGYKKNSETLDADTARIEAAETNEAQFDILQELITRDQAEVASLEASMASGTLSQSESTEVAAKISSLNNNIKTRTVMRDDLVSSIVGDYIPTSSTSNADRKAAIDAIMADAAGSDIYTAVKSWTSSSIYTQTAENALLLHYIGGYHDIAMNKLGLTGKTQLRAMMYNLNGAPSRNISLSNDTGDSAIAKMVGRISVANFMKAGMDSASSVSEILGKFLGGQAKTDNAKSELAKMIGSDVAGSMTEGLDFSAIREDAFLHNAGGLSSPLALSAEYDKMLIPRVYNSSSFTPSYHVDIREVCVSTDRYSLLRLFWTISTLIPYAVPMQTTRSGKQALSITPRSPMYATAFVKGVMNLPRCIISNMSLEFDPKFQTTEGVPTEVNISLDMTAFLSVMTTPVCGSIWSASFGTGEDEQEISSDDNYSLITQMFNPTSSINMIATLCGLNVVFLKPDQSLWAAWAAGGIFGKSTRAFKNMVANLKKGYVGSKLSDWVTGTDSNFVVGLMTR